MAPADLAAFRSWCETSDISSDARVEMEESETTGVGLRASAAIQSDVELLRIPQSASLSVAQLSRAGAGIEQALAPLLASLEHTNALALAICLRTDAIDHARGPLGPWAALWPALPEGGWGIADDEWRELSWWRELSQVHTQQESAARVALDTKIAPYFASNPQLGGAPTWEAFRWACSVISSRAVAVEMSGETQPALVPLLDLLNHRAAHEANCCICYDQHEGSDSFVVRTKCAVPAGQELSICYGVKDNAQLAAGYGFAMEQNVHDALLLRVPMGRTEDPMTAQRLGMLPRGMAGMDGGGEGAEGAEACALAAVSWDLDQDDPSSLSAPQVSTELLLLLALANAASTTDLFMAMGRASGGSGTAADWQLLARCCEAQTTALPSQTALTAWVPMATAALAARRALLLSTAAFAAAQEELEQGAVGGALEEMGMED